MEIKAGPNSANVGLALSVDSCQVIVCATPACQVVEAIGEVVKRVARALVERARTTVTRPNMANVCLGAIG